MHTTGSRVHPLRLTPSGSDSHREQSGHETQPTRNRECPPPSGPGCEPVRGSPVKHWLRPTSRKAFRARPPIGSVCWIKMLTPIVTAISPVANAWKRGVRAFRHSQESPLFLCRRPQTSASRGWRDSACAHRRSQSLRPPPAFL